MTVDADSRARTHLANERTFLAWFRTGVALVALGLAGAQFLSFPGGETVVAGLSTLMIATGALLVVIGLVRYRAGRRDIDATSFRPASTSVTLAAALALLAAVVAIGFVWLVHPVS